MTLTSQQLSALSSVGFIKSPVALGFLDTPPDGLPRIPQAQPAGCGYWKAAAEGGGFYTTPEDHENCPVGAFTHGVELSPAKTQELQSLIGTMIELKYLQPDEVPGIPHRSSPMKVTAYAPLAQATFDPDVVIFRGSVRQVMLMSEAARSAGVFETGAAMGRPACAMVPQAMSTAAAVASLGCIGNRVYTSLGDDELYLTVPGAKVGAVLDKLETIVTANRELEKFHRGRLEA